MKKTTQYWLVIPAILIQVAPVILWRQHVNKKVQVKTDNVVVEKEEKSVEKPRQEAVENSGGQEQSSSRSDKLTCFFNRHDSVLANHADTFIASADKNNFDYRLMAAISFIESTSCKNYPQGSYNCWGWGSAKINFTSFDRAIIHISQRLANSYYYRAWQKDREDYWKLAVVYNGGNQVKWHNDLLTTMKAINDCPQAPRTVGLK